MIAYGYGLAGYIVTLISLIHGSFALIVSFLVIGKISYHQYRHRLKREEKITLILSANIYLFVLVFEAGLIPLNIETLIGDVYGKRFDSASCEFKGYFFLSMCCAMYHAFIVQAFFRLCRIVYSKYRWVQLQWFYLVITPIQIAEAFALLSPILIWDDMLYLPKDHYCYVPFTKVRGTLWLVAVIYGIPLVCLTAMYTQITLFIRRHWNSQTSIIRRRQKRDLLAVRRIFVHIGVLFVLGTPAMTFLFIFFVTGKEQPLTYRVVWIGAETGVAVLSVTMIFMTTQLKKIFIQRPSHNRIIPVTQLRHMRTTLTAQ